VLNTKIGETIMEDFIYIWFLSIGFVFGYGIAKAIAWIKEK
jgi:hypothetical protein